MEKLFQDLSIQKTPGLLRIQEIPESEEILSYLAMRFLWGSSLFQTILRIQSDRYAACWLTWFVSYWIIHNSFHILLCYCWNPLWATQLLKWEEKKSHAFAASQGNKKILFSMCRNHVESRESTTFHTQIVRLKCFLAMRG